MRVHSSGDDTTVSFGRFRFDAGTKHLYRDNDRLDLPPSSAAVLARLLERPGDLVPFDELIGSTVGPAAPEALRTAIRQLRLLLRDPADHPMFIATERGSGYRFIAPVRKPEERQTSEDSSAAPPDELLRWLTDDESAIDFSVVWLAGAVPFTWLIDEWLLIPVVMVPAAIRLGARWRAFRRLRRECVTAQSLHRALTWAEERRDSGPTSPVGWRRWLRRIRWTLAGTSAVFIVATTITTGLARSEPAQQYWVWLVVACLATVIGAVTTLVADAVVNPRPLLFSVRRKARRLWRSWLLRTVAYDADHGDRFDDMARREVEMLVSRV
jgi:DNA-binding winged helix-turn-helix (wHTH) protein